MNWNTLAARARLAGFTVVHELDGQSIQFRRGREGCWFVTSSLPAFNTAIRWLRARGVTV